MPPITSPAAPSPPTTRSVPARPASCPGSRRPKWARTREWASSSWRTCPRDKPRPRRSRSRSVRDTQVVGQAQPNLPASRRPGPDPLRREPPRGALRSRPIRGPGGAARRAEPAWERTSFRVNARRRPRRGVALALIRPTPGDNLRPHEETRPPRPRPGPPRRRLPRAPRAPRQAPQAHRSRSAGRARHRRRRGRGQEGPVRPRPHPRRLRRHRERRRPDAHQLRGGRGARGPAADAAATPAPGRLHERRPRDPARPHFAVVFDDIHLTPGQAQRARGAVAAFLQTGVAEGDLVTLVASAGGAWWTARMPEGRDALIAILKRLDGRYIPDPSPDRITEFEAMRIDEYQDEQMAWQVQRRFETTARWGSRRTRAACAPRTRSAATPACSLERCACGPRGPPARQLAQPDHAGDHAARDRVDVRHQGPQGHGPRLAGLRLRRPAQADEGRDSRLATAQRADLLHRHPGAPGAARRLHRRLRPPGSRSQDVVAVLADLSREAEGTEALALDTGGFVVKNSNDLSGGMTRVSNESRAYYLLGYNPTDLRRDGKFRKIEVKVRPPKSKNLNVRARRGYYAPLEGQVAEGAKRNADPAHRPRARLAVRDPGRAAARLELRLRRGLARPDERADRGRDRREGAGLQAGGRPLDRRPGVPDRGPAPRDAASTTATTRRSR